MIIQINHVLFENIELFLSKYEPLSICTSNGNDDRFINRNLSLFLYDWYDWNVYLLNLIWASNNLTKLVEECVQDLPKGRMCAMLGIKAPNGEPHAYLLYRDSNEMGSIAFSWLENKIYSHLVGGCKL